MKKKLLDLITALPDELTESDKYDLKAFHDFAQWCADNVELLETGRGIGFRLGCTDEMQAAFGLVLPEGIRTRITNNTKKIDS